MHVYAIAALKGGVGKTTATVNLAALAARSGRRVLVWDLDPQASATWALGVDALGSGGAVRVVTGDRPRRPLPAPVGVGSLDVLPADFSLRHLDIELVEGGKPRRRMGRALEPLADRYDDVFLDCPPGATVAIESALRAADTILVPVQPGAMSVRAFETFRRFVRADNRLRRRQLLGFLSMVDRRKAGHRELATRLPGSVPDLLPTVIPLAADLERMGERRAPLVSTSPSSPASRAYEALWEAIVARTAS